MESFPLRGANEVKELAPEDERRSAEEATGVVDVSCASTAEGNGGDMVQHEILPFNSDNEVMWVAKQKW